MFREIMAAASSALQWFALGLISIYRVVISPVIGPRCRFLPTCSEFTQDAIRAHGACRGIFLGGKRLLKCHPWHAGGYDPVPQPEKIDYER